MVGQKLLMLNIPYGTKNFWYRILQDVTVMSKKLKKNNKWKSGND